jgi:hypothetical protein
MNRRVRLPDFGKYFRTSNRRHIDFVCRDAPNLLHDIALLRSYVHDASFDRSKIRLAGQVLSIPLQRDRWELYKESEELQRITATLTISPALAMKWKSAGKARTPSRFRKFFIRDVYLGESYWDTSDEPEVVFTSVGSKSLQLRITVSDPFVISLTDQA